MFPGQRKQDRSFGVSRYFSQYASHFITIWPELDNGSLRFGGVGREALPNTLAFLESSISKRGRNIYGIGLDSIVVHTEDQTGKVVF